MDNTQLMDDAMQRLLLLTRRVRAIVYQTFKVGRLLFLWTVTTVVLMDFLAPKQLDEKELVILALASAVILLTVRSAIRLGAQALFRRDQSAQHTLIIGANRSTEHLVRALLSDDKSGCRIEGFLDDDPGRRDTLEKHGIRYLGQIRNLESLLVERVIDCVYVRLPMRSSYDAVQTIVHLCEGVGVPVRVIADLFPRHTIASTPEHVADIPTLAVVAKPSGDVRFPQKRAIEWALSSALFVILSPLLALAAPNAGLAKERPMLFGPWRAGRQHAGSYSGSYVGNEERNVSNDNAIV